MKLLREIEKTAVFFESPDIIFSVMQKPFKKCVSYED
jgi:hypothetical protein